MIEKNAIEDMKESQKKPRREVMTMKIDSCSENEEFARVVVAVFAARSYGLENIVFIGNLTTITPIRNVFEEHAKTFGVNFLIPKDSQFGTVIGAALNDAE